MLNNYNKVYILSLIFIFLFSSLALTKQFEGSIPEDFAQSPVLDQKVEEGILPDVEKRLPEEPYIVEPNERIGDYGGTLRAATLNNPNGWGEDTMVMDMGMGFTKPSSDGSEILPNFAKKFELSNDQTTWTFHLREGVKWSDGEPFTAEDIMFWYEDILLNEELTPAIWEFWQADGEVMEIEKLDEYTIKIKFESPRPFFANRLTHEGYNFYQPKHYLKQFHPDYTDSEELQKKVEEAGFDEWYQLFEDKNMKIREVPLKEDLPTLASYVLVDKTSSRRIYERNPYFWKIDTEGNQLPYIDRIETEVVSDREILSGMIMSGEIDFAAFNTDIRDYPMYKNYEEEGNYTTHLWTGGFSSEVIYMFNMMHEDKQLRDIFNKVKFRKAMSLAIDRDEINESIYFGKAKPGQYTVLPSSKYYESEFAEAYAEYKPEKAKSLLDEIGLKDTDGDGYRELPSGDDFTFTLEYQIGETVKIPNVELVVSHWKEVGIDVNSKQISGELHSQRGSGNMLDASIWHGDKATDVLFPSQAQFFVPTSNWGQMITWTPWSQWFITNGKDGEEPPAEIKELYGWWEEMQEDISEERRIELGKKILQKQAENLWVIGTVGEGPWPAITNENLRNIPDDVLWVWDTMWTTTLDPEQFFFENGNR